MSAKLTGKVKFFNKAKGFGFIIGEDNKEYFVHATGLVDHNIQENDEVEFDLKEGKKGLNAVDVTII